MKLIEWDTLIAGAFRRTTAYRLVESHIREAITAITWPPGNDKFIIRSESGKKSGEGSGVKPIKDAFVESLKGHGWVPEHRRFDAHYSFQGGRPLPFVVEWETGNISSSHRAINRIALGMLDQQISGGVLVVPSRRLYAYLTDRVGNDAELAPYKPLWKLWSTRDDFGYLAIVTVEHDGTSPDVPRIPKGTDGRSLV